jgi:hypothetical protein
MVGMKNIKVYTILLEVRFTIGQRDALTTVIKKNAGPEPKFAFLLELLFLPQQRTSFQILLLLLAP